MRRQEVIINVLLILFSLGMIFHIIPAWTAAPQEFGLSGGTLPTLCCSVIGILAAFQLFSGFVKGIRPDNGKGLTMEVMFHIIKWFAPMFCIIPLWYYFGFLPGSISVIFVLLLLAGRRDFKLIIPLAVIVPTALMLVLRYGLQVPTP